MKELVCILIVFKSFYLQDLCHPAAIVWLCHSISGFGAILDWHMWPQCHVVIVLRHWTGVYVCSEITFVDVVVHFLFFVRSFPTCCAFSFDYSAASYK